MSSDVSSVNGMSGEERKEAVFGAGQSMCDLQEVSNCTLVGGVVLVPVKYIQVNWI